MRLNLLSIIKKGKKKLEVNKSKINEVVPQDVKIINKDVCKILPNVILKM